MFSKRSGSKGKRHFRRRSTRHRRRTHKRKGGMMSSAASASKPSASNPSASEVRPIKVWGHWKSKTNHRDYLQGKTFNIATNKTIADLKRAISEHISKKYESGYELPASTKIMSRETKIKYWVADDTHIRNVPDELEIELPM